MADDADIANEHLNSQLSRAIDKIRKNATVEIGSKYCEECDEEVPQARRELGFSFCVSCAEIIERQEALFVNN
jgi:RNA polymerase-binding transcription factor DksA